LVRMGGPPDDTISLSDPLSGVSTYLATVPRGRDDSLTFNFLYAPARQLLVWTQGSTFTARLMVEQLDSHQTWQLAQQPGEHTQFPALSSDVLAWQVEEIGVGNDIEIATYQAGPIRAPAK